MLDDLPVSVKPEQVDARVVLITGPGLVAVQDDDTGRLVYEDELQVAAIPFRDTF